MARNVPATTGADAVSSPITSGVQRSGDARGDCVIVCALTKFQY